MKNTLWFGSKFCSSLSQEIEYNENTKTLKKDEFLDRSARKLHRVSWLPTVSTWVISRRALKIAGKTSGLLSARDTVPLATTRAITVTSLSPPKSNVSVPHSIGLGNVVFQLPRRVKKVAGGMPRYQQMVRPKVETSSKGSVFLLLSRVKLDLQIGPDASNVTQDSNFLF